MAEETEKLLRLLTENREQIQKILGSAPAPASSSSDSQDSPPAGGRKPSVTFPDVGEGVKTFEFVPPMWNDSQTGGVPFMVQDRPFDLPSVSSPLGSSRGFQFTPPLTPWGASAPGWYVPALKTCLQLDTKNTPSHIESQLLEAQEVLFRISMGVMTSQITQGFYPYLTAPVLSRMMALMMASLYAAPKEENMWEIITANKSLIGMTSDKCAEVLLNAIVIPVLKYGGCGVRLQDLLEQAVQYIARVLKLNPKRRGPKE